MCTSDQDNFRSVMIVFLIYDWPCLLPLMRYYTVSKIRPPNHSHVGFVSFRDRQLIHRRGQVVHAQFPTQFSLIFPSVTSGKLALLEPKTFFDLGAHVVSQYSRFPAEPLLNKTVKHYVAELKRLNQPLLERMEFEAIKKVMR